jgi:glycosyltransferase involved in cell wall biosynthesis
MLILENEMEQPYFSIVIPSFNRAYLLNRVLDSALGQKFESYEVIVVDDGSEDNTREVVTSYDNPRLIYVYQDNSERAAARNRGASVARGKYVTFCDSDDFLYPFYLEEAKSLINKHGEVPWLHLAYEIKRENNRVLKMNAHFSDFTKVLAKGNPLSCLGVFIRKDVFLENRFNESRQMSGSEDWELWLRISSRYQLVYSRRICASLISHDGRSVIQTSELKLQLRKYLSIGFALDDESVKRTYGAKRNIMHAYFDTYIALHLLLAGSSGTSLKYIYKAFLLYPPSLFSRRALAILRLFVRNIFIRH